MGKRKASDSENDQSSLPDLDLVDEKNAETIDTETNICQEEEDESMVVSKESPDFFLDAELHELDREFLKGRILRDKPIRFLDDFTLFIYDAEKAKKNEFAFLFQVREAKIDLIATGLVSPVFEKDDDEDSVTDPLPISFETSELLSYDVEFDEEGIPIFWLETEYAWYKLGTPSISYTDAFVQSVITLYVTGRLLHMVMNDPENQVNEEKIQASLEMLKIKIGTVELELSPMHWEYVYDDLKEALVHFTPPTANLQHPVLQGILKKKRPLKFQAQRSVRTVPSTARRSHTSAQKSKPDCPATFTPRVNQIAEELDVYRSNVECIGDFDMFHYPAKATTLPSKKSEQEPKNIGDLVQWKLAGSKHYGEIQSLTSYSAHILIMTRGIETMLDDFATPNSFFATYTCQDVELSKLTYAEPFEVTALYHEDRFIQYKRGKTCPSCEKKKLPSFPTEYHLECRDNPFLDPTCSLLDLFFTPITIDKSTTPYVTVEKKTYFCGDFVYFRPTEPGPALYLLGQINVIEPTFPRKSNGNSLIFSGGAAKKKFKYDEISEQKKQTSEVMYVYKKIHALGTAPPSLQQGPSARCDPTTDEKGGDEEEHAQECLPCTSAIVKITLLGRWNAMCHKNNEKHFHRRLIRTKHEVSVSSDRLMGTLVVLPSNLINEVIYFQDPHHFVLDHYHPSHDPREYVDLQKMYATKLVEKTNPELVEILNSVQPNTSPNLIAHLNEVAKLYTFAKEKKKMVALDLFSGCGGLTVGFDSDTMPTCHTKYAIEMNEHAALTFQSNFKDSTVYQMDCNQFLKKAILEKDTTYPLPQEIDVIYCGPPCQGFSGLNQFQKSDDSKNSLIPVSLSFVEHFRPKFFLLENVVGMLHYRLGGIQASKHRVEGGAKTGVLRLIVRTLLELGYQVSWTMLQAGNYGVPQNRRRVFVMATLPELQLPEWPEATHAFVFSPAILNINDAYTRTFCKVPYALLPYTTVECAISDLQPFEYTNPNKVMKWSDEKVRNLSSQIPQIVGSSSKTSVKEMIGRDVSDYFTLPQSDFQRQLRLVDQDGSADYQAECLNHITRPYNDLTVERICNIPKVPSGADHRSLPKPLAPWALSHPDSAASRHNGWKGLFGRLRLDGVFKTATTDMHPMSKTGTLLHPWQNRVVTVRETARSQGFPDNFHFKAYGKDVKEMYRQTGNAVPPFLAAALNRVFLKALHASHLANPSALPSSNQDSSSEDQA